MRGLNEIKEMIGKNKPDKITEEIQEIPHQHFSKILIDLQYRIFHKRHAFFC